jgi:hypothetical protein
VEQSHGLLSAMDLWAKKAAENSSPDAYVSMQAELAKLQAESDLLQSNIANERSELETSRMQLADFDDALKKELAWLRSVDRYLLDAADPCADLAERKSRLHRTKVCKAMKR